MFDPRSRFTWGVLCIGLMAGFIAPVAARADGHRIGDSREGGGRRNEGILPPQSRPFGASYGEWSARYWQWVLGTPEATNPALDATGEFAAVGQSGPVWFVAGTFGNSVERTLRLPTGRGLFVAVHPWIFGSAVFDCEPSVPGVPCDIATLRSSASAAAGAAVVEASLDGDAVQDIGDYRAQSPNGFPVTLPDGAVFGLPAGTFQPQVSDGYWLMLAPLSEGRHLITTHVVNAPAGIDMTETLHLIVGHADDSATASDQEFTTTTSRSNDKATGATVKKSWTQVKSYYR